MKRSILLFFTGLALSVQAHVTEANKIDGTVVNSPATEVSNINYTSSSIAVDLGLPSGTKWASINLGAENPEDYGLYFAWGDITGYPYGYSGNYSFFFEDYRWCNGSYDTLTKYCTNGDYGIVDDKTVLDLEDDAAHVAWGGYWRMPTIEDINELLSYSINEHTTLNGIKGVMFTSKTNGNSIFLPTAGYAMGEGRYDQEWTGYYWSSSLVGEEPDFAHYLRLNWNEDGANANAAFRYFGYTIRPVFKSPDAPSSIISFADENAKALCVANWDVNGDGELSYTEAAGVTSLGNVFRGIEGKNITSFEELKYFTGLTSIGAYAFNGCEKLTSISIPSSVVSIGNSVLRDCGALSYITVEEGNSKYNSNGNCNAIIETESGRLIAGCKNTIIPNSVTIIEQDAFYGNHGLTSLIIPNSVTSINLSAFEGCDHLVSIVIPSSVNQLGDRILIRCESLKAVKLNISDPITIHDDFISNEYSTTLYVPKNSKAAYMVANHWKDITNIKEFPDADVNQDGEVDVVDVVDVARFVVGTPSEKFEEFLADLNSDDNVNIVDAVVLVNEIAGDVNFSRPAGVEGNSDDIYLLYTENDKNRLSLQLNGNGKYTALQFDLLLPNGIDVKDMQMNSLRLQDHQLLFNEISDGLYRVIAISTSNSTFNANDGELVNIELEGDATNDIMVDQIHFVTPQAGDMIFDAINANKGSIPDGINTLQISDNKKAIFNLNGQKLDRLQKGVNVIGTKKVIVR